MAVRIKITLDIQNAILDNVFKKEISALYLLGFYQGLFVPHAAQWVNKGIE